MRPQSARWTHVLLALLLLGGATRLAGQGTGSVQDSVRALEQARAQALLRADTTALGRMVAPGFVEVSRLGTLRTRADNIGEIASGALKLTSIRYDSTQVHLYGDVAVLTAISENAGVFHGMPFTGRVRYTRIFVRGPGGWQAVLMQQTPMQQPLKSG